MFKIGWGPVPRRDDLPDDWEPGDPWPASDYLVKSISVPKGAWMISLPIRVRWGGPGPQGPNSGISIKWDEDHIDPQPIMFAFSDHLDVEAGKPGDADMVYPLSCAIVVAKATVLRALLTTTGDNVCGIVDGDGFRWASCPW